MESTLRQSLIDWLSADPLLSASLNAITEETPSRASPPWLAIGTSASADWSTKERRGREVRMALELQMRAEDQGEAAAIAGLIEDRIEALPPDQPGYRIITTQFLRARAEQRAGNLRSVLIEYRFRLLENA